MKNNYPANIKIHHADLWGLREDKYKTLLKSDVTKTRWETLKPQHSFYLFIPQDVSLLKEYEKWQRISDIMPVNSVGIVTARDHLTIHWTKQEAWATVQDFAALSESKAREKYQLGNDARDWKVKLAQQDIGQSGPDKKFLKTVLYRPFDIRWTYYTAKTRGFICMPRPEVMRHMLEGENVGIHTCRQVISNEWIHTLATNRITDDCYVSNKTRERGYLFPLYLHDDSGMFSNRVNFAPDFMNRLISNFMIKLNPVEIFNYIYAIFHSPEYRSRYAEFLKMDFPRVPVTGSLDLFRKLSKLGGELVSLHLMESPGLEKRITKFKGSTPSGEIEKITYSEETVWIDKAKSQSFLGVPEEVWNFHIGGYQVCEKWLKDRKGRQLTEEDINHYHRIVVALKETIRIMIEIDEVIEQHGGFPHAFAV